MWSNLPRRASRAIVWSSRSGQNPPEQETRNRKWLTTSRQVRQRHRPCHPLPEPLHRLRQRHDADRHRRQVAEVLQGRLHVRAGQRGIARRHPVRRQHGRTAHRLDPLGGQPPDRPRDGQGVGKLPDPAPQHAGRHRSGRLGNRQQRQGARSVAVVELPAAQVGRASTTPKGTTSTPSRPRPRAA